MTNTLLHLFFSGMIVFVNNRPDPNMMTAYLVKADNHAASLRVEITAGSTVNSISGADCKKTTDGGRTFLDCQKIEGPIDIELKPGSAKSAHRMYAKPLNVRPFDKKDASNLSWLVHMSTVDEDRGVAKKFEEVSNLVKLKMEFGWARGQTCELDQLEVGDCLGSNCSFQVDPIHFAKSISGTLGHVQAVAETVMFELEMPNDAVSLWLKERGGSGMINVDLNCSSGKCPDLFIYNNPTAMPDVVDVGQHFAGYYYFAAGNPQVRLPVRMRENAVPFMVGGMGQMFTCPLAIPAAGGGTPTAGSQTRIICPMVVYENK